jgi:adenosine deaminase
VSVGVNTDNRLMSGITLSGECDALLEHTPLTRDDLLQMQIQAAQHSFLPAALREAALAALRAFSVGAQASST